MINKNLLSNCSKKRNIILPIIILVLYIAIYGINWLISVPNKAKTEDLYKEFVGRTFSGFDSDSAGATDIKQRYTFKFNNKKTVSVIKESKYEHSDYLKSIGAKDESYNDRESLPYKLKVTLFGKKYVYIKGFGSDGVDISDNSEGLPIGHDIFGMYFEYDNTSMHIMD